MSEVRCYSSAAASLKGPDGFRTHPAFRDKRWTLAAEQRDERIRLFGRKLLARLDGMDMPFYAKVGLIDLREARRRYVMAMDPWTPAESPFLDGVAIEFAPIFLKEVSVRAWHLFGEVGFDVARLAQTKVLWGGFAECNRPGMFMIYDGHAPTGWAVDGRTYTVRNRPKLPMGS